LNYRENKKVAQAEQGAIKKSTNVLWSLWRSKLILLWEGIRRGAALSAEMQIDFLTILHRTS